MEDLLKHMLNIRVFGKFGLKLYSLDQNITFLARRQRNEVRLLNYDKWTEMLDKRKVCDDILENLVEKTREAVDMYRDGIPEHYMNHFNTYTQTIFDYRDSPNPE